MIERQPETAGNRDSMLATLKKLHYQGLKMPIIGPVLRYATRQVLSPRFSDSASYWVKRYAQGGYSGQGSYNKLAEQKAEVINRFVAEHQIATVIEFGCGDGNQLRLANYPHYIGYDISPEAIAQCQAIFKDDPTKSFHPLSAYQGATADLILSLDVIFHLIEDDVFDAYMRRLFAASNRYVIIYSSNKDDQTDVFVPHVKHRRFTTWVKANMPEWTLIQHIPNRYPYTGDPATSSFADFYIYERQTEVDKRS